MDQRDAVSDVAELRILHWLSAVNHDGGDRLPGTRRGAPVLAAKVQQLQVRVDRTEQSVDTRVAGRRDIEPAVARGRFRGLSDGISLQRPERSKLRTGEPHCMGA